ncbi:hypothetical protein BDZ89DRAFT_1040537 [Hymenopellis radicata]|nr:hypothetical protein BDZ89DRAFT_1040537 [Hymenopellis radicata]
MDLPPEAYSDLKPQTLVILPPICEFRLLRTSTEPVWSPHLIHQITALLGTCVIGGAFFIHPAYTRNLRSKGRLDKDKSLRLSSERLLATAVQLPRPLTAMMQAEYPHSDGLSKSSHGEECPSKLRMLGQSQEAQGELILLRRVKKDLEGKLEDATDALQVARYLGSVEERVADEVATIEGLQQRLELAHEDSKEALEEQELRALECELEMDRLQWELLDCSTALKAVTRNREQELARLRQAVANERLAKAETTADWLPKKWKTCSSPEVSALREQLIEREAELARLRHLVIQSSPENRSKANDSVTREHAILQEEVKTTPALLLSLKASTRDDNRDRDALELAYRELLAARNELQRSHERLEVLHEDCQSSKDALRASHQDQQAKSKETIICLEKELAMADRNQHTKHNERIAGASSTVYIAKATDRGDAGKTFSPILAPKPHPELCKISVSHRNHFPASSAPIALPSSVPVPPPLKSGDPRLRSKIPPSSVHVTSPHFTHQVHAGGSESDADLGLGLIPPRLPTRAQPRHYSRDPRLHNVRPGKTAQSASTPMSIHVVPGKPVLSPLPVQSPMRKANRMVVGGVQGIIAVERGVIVHSEALRGGGIQTRDCAHKEAPPRTVEYPKFVNAKGRRSNRPSLVRELVALIIIDGTVAAVPLTAHTGRRSTSAGKPLLAEAASGETRPISMFATTPHRYRDVWQSAVHDTRDVYS